MCSILLASIIMVEVAVKVYTSFMTSLAVLTLFMHTKAIKKKKRKLTQRGMHAIKFNNNLLVEGPY